MEFVTVTDIVGHLPNAFLPYQLSWLPVKMPENANASFARL